MPGGVSVHRRAASVLTAGSAFYAWATGVGPGAWWPMQDASGTTAEDVIGSFDLTGTNVTAAQAGPGASPFDKAFSFSGSGSKFDAGDQAMFSSQVGSSGKSSFMVLANFSALSNYRSIFGKEAAGQYEYDAFAFANGAVKWQVPLDNGAINVIECTSSAGAVATSTWYLLTFVVDMDPTSIQVYVNTSLAASSSSPSSPAAWGGNGTAAFQIGNRADSALTPFAGKMLQALYFNGIALDSTAVAAAHAALVTDGVL